MIDTGRSIKFKKFINLHNADYPHKSLQKTMTSELKSHDSMNDDDLPKTMCPPNANSVLERLKNKMPPSIRLFLS